MLIHMYLGLGRMLLGKNEEARVDFKKVNDNFGHPLGDEVLRRVAGIIRRICRSVDIAARYGGEEFVLLLPETDGRGAVTAAEKIRKAVEEMEIPQEKGIIRVTISIGVAVFPSQTKAKADLIHLADEALYAAKGAGKNRVVLAGEEPLSPANPFRD